eukprot:m.44271 g.44271  ORF g.44271 m.44271 type:complete len:1186 (-) comp8513_c0_seq1:1446-5003(-)
MRRLVLAAALSNRTEMSRAYVLNTSGSNETRAGQTQRQLSEPAQPLPPYNGGRSRLFVEPPQEALPSSQRQERLSVGSREIFDNSDVVDEQRRKIGQASLTTPLLSNSESLTSQQPSGREADSGTQRTHNNPDEEVSRSYCYPPSWLFSKHKKENSDLKKENEKLNASLERENEKIGADKDCFEQYLSELISNYLIPTLIKSTQTLDTSTREIRDLGGLESVAALNETLRIAIPVVCLPPIPSTTQQLESFRAILNAAQTTIDCCWRLPDNVILPVDIKRIFDTELQNLEARIRVAVQANEEHKTKVRITTERIENVKRGLFEVKRAKESTTPLDSGKLGRIKQDVDSLVEHLSDSLHLEANTVTRLRDWVSDCGLGQVPLNLACSMQVDDKAFKELLRLKDTLNILTTEPVSPSLDAINHFDTALDKFDHDVSRQSAILETRPRAFKDLKELRKHALQTRWKYAKAQLKSCVASRHPSSVQPAMDALHQLSVSNQVHEARVSSIEAEAVYDAFVEPILRGQVSETATNQFRKFLRLRNLIKKLDDLEAWMNRIGKVAPIIAMDAEKLVLPASSIVSVFNTITVPDMAPKFKLFPAKDKRRLEFVGACRKLCGQFQSWKATSNPVDLVQSATALAELFVVDGLGPSVSAAIETVLVTVLGQGPRMTIEELNQLNVALNKLIRTSPHTSTSQCQVALDSISLFKHLKDGTINAETLPAARWRLTPEGTLMLELTKSLADVCAGLRVRLADPVTRLDEPMTTQIMTVVSGRKSVDELAANDYECVMVQEGMGLQRLDGTRTALRIKILVCGIPQPFEDDASIPVVTARLTGNGREVWAQLPEENTKTSLSVILDDNLMAPNGLFNVATRFQCSTPDLLAAVEKYCLRKQIKKRKLAKLLCFKVHPDTARSGDSTINQAELFRIGQFIIELLDLNEKGEEPEIDFLNLKCKKRDTLCAVYNAFQSRKAAHFEKTLGLQFRVGQWTNPIALLQHFTQNVKQIDTGGVLDKLLPKWKVVPVTNGNPNPEDTPWPFKGGVKVFKDRPPVILSDPSRVLIPGGGVPSQCGLWREDVITKVNLVKSVKGEILFSCSGENRAEKITARQEDLKWDNLVIDERVTLSASEVLLRRAYFTITLNSSGESTRLQILPPADAPLPRGTHLIKLVNRGLTRLGKKGQARGNLTIALTVE